jgi:hypothetical protein
MKLGAIGLGLLVVGVAVATAQENQHGTRAGVSPPSPTTGPWAQSSSS